MRIAVSALLLVASLTVSWGCHVSWSSTDPETVVRENVGEEFVEWTVPPYNLNGNHGNRPAACGVRGVLKLIPPPGMTAARICMKLQNPRGMVFNIGDSPSNDAFCGDYVSHKHTKYNSEIFGFDGEFRACNSDIVRQSGGDSYVHDVKHVIKTGSMTVQVAKWQMGATNYDDLSVEAVGKGLFFLDTLYIALNRVVLDDFHPDRVGSGLCSVCVTWAANWDDFPPLSEGRC